MFTAAHVARKPPRCGVFPGLLAFFIFKRLPEPVALCEAGSRL